MEEIHIPVLLQEVIEALSIKEDGIYVDLTLGRAGHSSEILKRIPKGKLICFDQDEEAIPYSKQRLSVIGNNFQIVHANFKDLAKELDQLGIDKVDGILADLGVSSPQFDEASRGFSYQKDGRLDMRMDQSKSFSAYELVNQYSFEDLIRVLRDYGEEKDAYRIAKEICKQRESKPIETTFELVEVIKKAKPKSELAKKGHPAKQSFQAFRIEVNHEEEALEKMLEDAPKRLKQGGRLAIISFMSIDDRLVKNAFNALSKVEGNRTGFLRPEEIQVADFTLISKKPIVPSANEIARNHRAASSKLRILEKK